MVFEMLEPGIEDAWSLSFGRGGGGGALSCAVCVEVEVDVVADLVEAVLLL